MGRRREKRINEISDLVIEKLNAPYSGGDQFAVQERLKVQDTINTNDLFSKQDLTQLLTFKEKIKNVVDNLYKGKTYQDWQILNFHADYFVNTCRYSVPDVHLSRLINQIVRCAFLYGRAGLYFDKVKVGEGEFYYPRAVFIRKVKFDIYDNISYAEITPIREALVSKGDFKPMKVEVLEKEKLVDLKIFQWGSLAMGAYVSIYPFVKIQNQLLDQLLLESFFFNKKWIYTLANSTTSTEEVEAFLNPKNPLITQIVGNSIPNKFDVFDTRLVGSASATFIEFYREVCNIYYELIGRRANVEFKKERNLSLEVESAQESFTFTQDEWLNYFYWFCREVNEHPYMTLNKLRIKNDV